MYAAHSLYCDAKARDRATRADGPRIPTRDEFIERSEHRDTQALQAKLDESPHGQDDARNAFTKIDEKKPEDMERLRAGERKPD